MDKNYGRQWFVNSSVCDGRLPYGLHALYPRREWFFPFAESLMLSSDEVARSCQILVNGVLVGVNVIGQPARVLSSFALHGHGTSWSYLHYRLGTPN